MCRSDKITPVHWPTLAKRQSCYSLQSLIDWYKPQKTLASYNSSASLVLEFSWVVDLSLEVIGKRGRNLQTRLLRGGDEVGLII